MAITKEEYSRARKVIEQYAQERDARHIRERATADMDQLHWLYQEMEKYYTCVEEDEIRRYRFPTKVLCLDRDYVNYSTVNNAQWHEFQAHVQNMYPYTDEKVIYPYHAFRIAETSTITMPDVRE